MLYHAEVFWPGIVKRQLPVGVQPIGYTRHAVDASKTDRYGAIKLPAAIDLSKAYIFEAELDNRVLTKIALRVKLDDGRDLCIAAIKEPKGGLTAKTVWVNLSTDNHRTLDKAKYVRK